MARNDQTLVYIASNPKGDDLYQELKSHYGKTIYLDGSYRALPKMARTAVRLLEMIGRPVKGQPRIDEYLRSVLSRRALSALGRSVTPGPSTHIVYWHGLYPITEEWRSLGTNGTITDVAMDDTYFDHFGVPRGRPRALRERIWEINARNTHFIFTHSDWAAESNARLYPDQRGKIRRVGWGSDMKPLPAEDVFCQKRKQQVVCVGHDYHRKGVDIYNEVARLLHHRFPTLECLVAGRPGDKIDPLSLRHLKVLGPVNRTELDRLLRESILFMLFSRFEPAGHVTIEAMSYGVPVICSNRGGIGEPVLHGETGYVCDIDNPEEIAENAAELLSNREKLRQFSYRAYEHATGSWQWKHTAERIYEHMSRVG